MKKENFILLLMLVSLIQLVAAPCGDVNSDRKVNIVDALLVVQSYVGALTTSPDQNSADVNGDGTVYIIDALLIAQYYVNTIDSLDKCPEAGTGQSKTIYKLWRRSLYSS